MYGRPRIHAELQQEGERIGAKRVGRLMRAAGIQGASRRRFKPRTTQRDRNAGPAPDLVDRDFRAEASDRLWVADITYVPTWSGFLYLAVVVDAWSRRVVGWSMATHLRSELVLDALNMATWQRRPERVIHHSDQGTQYTSIAFGLRCKEVGVRPSMGSVGDAYDNALCESFSRRSSASFSIGSASGLRRRPRWRYSTSSKASTIRVAAIRRSATCRPLTLSEAGRLPREPASYSPAARGKLSSPQGGGQYQNLSVHPSTKSGQLQAVAWRSPCVRITRMWPQSATPS